MGKIPKLLQVSLDRLKEAFADDRQALDLLQILQEKAYSLKQNENQKSEGRGRNKEGSSGEVIAMRPFPVPHEVVNDGHHFALFADGACRGNPGPGSWAAMGQSSDGQVIFELSGLNVITTNNKMELEGATSALRELREYLQSEGIAKDQAKVFLYSDSQYVVQGASSWLANWKKRGWKKADQKVPENLEYWQEMDRMMQDFPQLYFMWVKGHAGHPQNEHCDRLANMALDDAGL